jgi:hypothetical protein
MTSGCIGQVHSVFLTGSAEEDFAGAAAGGADGASDSADSTKEVGEASNFFRQWALQKR